MDVDASPAQGDGVALAEQYTLRFSHSAYLFVHLKGVMAQASVAAMTEVAQVSIRLNDADQSGSHMLSWASLGTAVRNVTNELVRILTVAMRGFWPDETDMNDLKQALRSGVITDRVATKGFTGLFHKDSASSPLSVPPSLERMFSRFASHWAGASMGNLVAIGTELRTYGLAGRAELVQKVDAWKRWLIEVGRVHALLAFAIHVSGGPPRRCPELALHRIADGGPSESEMQTVFIDSGTLCLNMTYNKTMSTLRSAKRTRHYLPIEVALPMFLYLCLVRPIEASAAAMVYGDLLASGTQPLVAIAQAVDSSPAQHAENTRIMQQYHVHLFCHHAGQMTPDELGRKLRRAFVDYVKEDISVSIYRHMILALSDRALTEAARLNPDTYANMAGHSALTARTSYGVSSVQMSTLEAHDSALISRLYHSNLGFADLWPGSDKLKPSCLGNASTTTTCNQNGSIPSRKAVLQVSSSCACCRVVSYDLHR